MGAFDGLKAGQVDNGCESYLRTSRCKLGQADRLDWGNHTSSIDW
jgi:hypothetical protein